MSPLSSAPTTVIVGHARERVNKVISRKTVSSYSPDLTTSCIGDPDSPAPSSRPSVCLSGCGRATLGNKLALTASGSTKFARARLALCVRAGTPAHTCNTKRINCLEPQAHLRINVSRRVLSEALQLSSADLQVRTCVKPPSPAPSNAPVEQREADLRVRPCVKPPSPAPFLPHLSSSGRSTAAAVAPRRVFSEAANLQTSIIASRYACG